ncbi:MAG TPA: beta-glucosidase BglX [Pyrinomonadaceae bacterium]|nr:beta-glucosidase BglX [Pyrinomonadaceae bacterium]
MSLNIYKFFFSTKSALLKPSVFLLFLLLFSPNATITGQQAVRKLSDSEIESRITALISRMTLAEKLGQLQQLDGEANGRYRPEHLELARQGLLGSTLNVRGADQVNELQKAALSSRLGIPILFGFDVIHGYRTIFPVPLGEAASWDPQLAEKSAAIAAMEARAAGVHWTFAPMVDIARDPRWGRIVEGSGEDTFLGSVFAYSRVRGFQGNDYASQDRVLATAKHFAAYGAAEAGRDYNTTDLSERTLREVYLPPFKSAVDAGAGSFMTAFNDLNGIPSTANSFLLKKILRDEWKFDGLVVSDYTSVKELIFHGLARDESDAARLALKGGTDMEMVSRLYNQYGEQLLKEGKISMAEIDQAVRHVLRIKFRLGLFERPFADPSLEKTRIFTDSNLEYARIAAERSFVLLKNENRTLPISENIGSIALIGSLADSKSDMLGSWSGDGRKEDVITILQELRNRFPQKKIIYEPGCMLPCENDQGFPAALEAARQAEFTIIVAGESADMSGEAASRSDIGLPGKQLELIKAIHNLNKPYAVVLVNGRPLTINWIAENSPAILEAWFPGTMAGPAIVNTLFGKSNPGGKLPVTFPRSVGQIPIYYNHKRTGRPFKAAEKYTSKYLDIENTPLFPFGFGLSYTTFRLDDLMLDKTAYRQGEPIRISVNLKNTGSLKGDEVVQIYLTKLSASVTWPIKQLKAFRRVTLQPGEQAKLQFELKPKDLEFLGPDLQPVIESGDYILYAGTSSEDCLQFPFTIIESERKNSFGKQSSDKANPKLSKNSISKSAGSKIISSKLSSSPKASSKLVSENDGLRQESISSRFSKARPLPAPKSAVPSANFSSQEDAFLEDLSQRTFRYFWEHSDPQTGLTLDRARTGGEAPAPGENHFRVASIAATGFALTSYCIAKDRSWLPAATLRQRVLATLDFFANKQEHKNGWFYHFVDQKTGERKWKSEVSSIDTALLLAGVLTAKQCWADDKQITSLADKIYHRVDFNWMLAGHPYLLSHGWRPENGWIPNRWNDYSEEAILYILAIGSPTHPIPPLSWYAWKRPWVEYGGYRYIAAVGPLFIHQYSHAWIDFRGIRESQPPFIDYFENSIKATLAQRKYAAEVLSRKYPEYSLDLWGLTASDYKNGYIAWGAPPPDDRIDGSIVPCAAAGSLMFTPRESLLALENMRSRFGDKIYGRYGFADAFNPHDGWVAGDVIGIDLGITLISLENARTGRPWFYFMQNDNIRYALKAAGFVN